ncbi:RHS repeat domain-containing protein [Bacteroides acidifaciens]|uniref:RHS repeat domain-containing protein n=2 Tax=Bacteroides acidifaciens TaxID=85831 RepID=UPI002557D6C3|nr:RHS repeat domain-containing protein [Bacteroides acidifaciens]
MVEENTDGQTVYNVYDAMGNRTDFSLFRGTTEISSISYGYNSNGWMTSMSGNGTSATYAYDGNGNRTSTTYGNGNVVSYTYNAANYPTLVANRSGSNTISSFVYTYALDGNVATKTDHTGKVTEYTYDGMNRLTEEVQKKNGVLVQSYAYTFDDFNNRSTLTAAGADAYTVAYSYDKNNRLLEDIKTSTDETAKTLYFYDPNGNQIGRSMETLTSSQDAESISATTAVASYEKSWYNGFNQMVGTKVDGVEATYSYAPSGLRLSKTIDGTTIDYALDGDFVAAELNGDTVTARYTVG